MQALAPRMGLLGCTTLEGFSLTVLLPVVNDFRGVTERSFFENTINHVGFSECRE